MWIIYYNLHTFNKLLYIAVGCLYFSIYQSGFTVLSAWSASLSYCLQQHTICIVGSLHACVYGIYGQCGAPLSVPVDFWIIPLLWHKPVLNQKLCIYMVQHSLQKLSQYICDKYAHGFSSSFGVPIKLCSIKCIWKNHVIQVFFNVNKTANQGKLLISHVNRIQKLVVNSFDCFWFCHSMSLRDICLC